MLKRWQLQDAKNRFSEVVDRALEEGPQCVTRHGKDVVVVVAKSEFDHRTRPARRKGTLVGFLRKLSFARTPLELERSRDTDRELEL